MEPSVSVRKSPVEIPYIPDYKPPAPGDPVSFPSSVSRGAETVSVVSAMQSLFDRILGKGMVTYGSKAQGDIQGTGSVCAVVVGLALIELLNGHKLPDVDAIIRNAVPQYRRLISYLQSQNLTNHSEERYDCNKLLTWRQDVLPKGNTPSLFPELKSPDQASEKSDISGKIRENKASSDFQQMVETLASKIPEGETQIGGCLMIGALFCAIVLKRQEDGTFEVHFLDSHKHSHMRGKPYHICYEGRKSVQHLADFLVLRFENYLHTQGETEFHLDPVILDSSLAGTGQIPPLENEELAAILLEQFLKQNLDRKEKSLVKEILPFLKNSLPAAYEEFVGRLMLAGESDKPSPDRNGIDEQVIAGMKAILEGLVGEERETSLNTIVIPALQEINSKVNMDWIRKEFAIATPKEGQGSSEAKDGEFKGLARSLMNLSSTQRATLINEYVAQVLRKGIYEKAMGKVQEEIREINEKLKKDRIEYEGEGAQLRRERSSELTDLRMTLDDYRSCWAEDPFFKDTEKQLISSMLSYLEGTVSFMEQKNVDLDEMGGMDGICHLLKKAASLLDSEQMKRWRQISLRTDKLFQPVIDRLLEGIPAEGKEEDMSLMFERCILGEEPEWLKGHLLKRTLSILEKNSPEIFKDLCVHLIPKNIIIEMMESGMQSWFTASEQQEIQKLLDGLFPGIWDDFLAYLLLNQGLEPKALVPEVVTEAFKQYCENRIAAGQNLSPFFCMETDTDTLLERIRMIPEMARTAFFNVLIAQVLRKNHYKGLIENVALSMSLIYSKEQWDENDDATLFDLNEKVAELKRYRDQRFFDKENSDLFDALDLERLDRWIENCLKKMEGGPNPAPVPVFSEDRQKAIGKLGEILSQPTFNADKLRELLKLIQQKLPGSEFELQSRLYLIKQASPENVEQMVTWIMEMPEGERTEFLSLYSLEVLQKEGED